MIAQIIRLLTGVHARWLGVEPVHPDGSIPQRVYFANHASHLDGPVIWASLPPTLRRKTRPVAARDYWSRGVVRRLLAEKVFRCVLIDRQEVNPRHNPLQPMAAVLAAGESLIIFPEGTRAMEEDQMSEFKPGLWHLARKHPEVELVPVCLENLNRILPKGEFLLIPLLAAVTFGPPIHLVEGEDKQAFLDRTRRAIQQLAEGACA